MALLEIIRSEFVVRRLSREDVIGDRQDLMSDRNDGPLVAATPFDPLIQGGEGRRFRATRSGGGFNQRHAQRRVTMPSTRHAPFTGALFLPRTDAAPAAQTAVARKP